MRRTPPTTIAALALAGALVLGACSGGTDPGTGGDAGTTATAGPAGAGQDSGTTDDAAETSPGPEDLAVDLEALPDPVAEVNGEPISKDDFLVSLEPELELARQAGGQGAPVDEVALRDAVLDNMVNRELVHQEGERLGLQASEEDVDAQLDSLAEQNGLESGEEFLTALEAQGLTEDVVRAEVSTLVLFDGILADRGGVQEPSEQELRDYYEQLTGQPADDDGADATDDAQAPPFEEVRDQLAEQLAEQQEQQTLTAIIEQLRADADIELHV